MHSPLVSVIIVVYNAHQTIAGAIESVLSQTYTNRELVIIDGGSNDGTLQVLEQYSQQFACYVSEKDSGIYDAMNKGVKAAKGEWLYFLGSDDVLYNKEVLSQMFSRHEVSDVDFLYGNVRFSSNNEIFGGERSYQELIAKNINHQAIFYKKNIFERIGLYDLGYKVLADYDLNLRVFREPGIIKKYVPLDICLFNNKGGTSNITIDTNFFADKLSYFLGVEKFPPGSPFLQQYYFYTGYVMLVKQKKFAGLSYCLRAFTSGPRKIFYILVFVKFILGHLGIGKKIKIV